MIVVKQERVYDTVPDGTYIAEIVGYTPASGKRIDNNTGEEKEWNALKFQFVLLEEDATINGKKISGQVYAAGKTEDGNLIINPGSALDKWLTTMGVNMDVGSELNLDSLKGKQCTVIVTTTEQIKKGKKLVYSNVTDIKPLSGMMKKAAESLHHAPAAQAVNDKVVDTRTAPVAASTPAVKATVKPAGKIAF